MKNKINYSFLSNTGRGRDAHHVTAQEPEGGDPSAAGRRLRGTPASSRAPFRSRCQATSTRVDDIAEMLAARLRRALLATCGLRAAFIEAIFAAIFAALSVHQAVVPPMINLQTLDPKLSKGGDGSPMPKVPDRHEAARMDSGSPHGSKELIVFGGSNAAFMFANYDVKTANTEYLF